MTLTAGEGIECIMVRGCLENGRDFSHMASERTLTKTPIDHNKTTAPFCHSALAGVVMSNSRNNWGQAQIFPVIHIGN